MTQVAGADEAELVAARIQAGAAEDARPVVARVVRHTPVLSSRGLSEACGGNVLLKAENLQRTGSFKLRGATHKISALERPRGVVAGSAGNHGQSLAYSPVTSAPVHRPTKPHEFGIPCPRPGVQRAS